MSYKDRLRPASYIPPEGDEIFFNVDTLERTGGKKGLTQEIIDSGESVSEDRGNKARIYPVEAYFVGPDYDIPTDEFFNSLSQTYTRANPGILVHPRWGNIPVMPFTFSQREELLRGTQVGVVSVVFTTIFPENYPATDLLNANQAALNVDLLEALTELSIGSFRFETFEAISNAISKIREAVSTISVYMEAITEGIQAAQDLIENIQGGIEGLLDDFAGNAFQIMAATQRLMRAPGKLVEGTISSFNNYKSMIFDLAETFNDDDESNPDSRVNNAVMMQLITGFGVAVTAENASRSGIATGNNAQPTGAAGVAVETEAPTVSQFLGTPEPVETGAGSPGFTSRSQAVSVIGSIDDTLNVFLENFDQAKEPLIADPAEIVDKTFWGDHDFFDNIQATTEIVNEIILVSAFNLAAEKRFTLKSESDLITECYKAYKNVDNFTLDFFANTNQIGFDEFYGLPAGREIVVYG